MDFVRLVDAYSFYPFRVTADGIYYRDFKLENQLGSRLPGLNTLIVKQAIQPSSLKLAVSAHKSWLAVQLEGGHCVVDLFVIFRPIKRDCIDAGPEHLTITIDDRSWTFDRGIPWQQEIATELLSALETWTY